MTFRARRTALFAATVIAVTGLVGGAVPGGPIGVAPNPAAASADADPDPATDPLPAAAADALATLGTDQGEALARRRLADHVAARSSADATALDAVWASVDDQRLLAVYSALSQVGTPYRSRRSEPGVGFDCSGLTSWAWAQAGVTLSRSSGSQIDAARRRDPAALQPGDLVYNPGHVVLYLGQGEAIVEAPHSGRRVRVVDWKQGRTLRFGDPLG